MERRGGKQGGGMKRVQYWRSKVVMFGGKEESSLFQRSFSSSELGIIVGIFEIVSTKHCSVELEVTRACKEL